MRYCFFLVGLVLINYACKQKNISVDGLSYFGSEITSEDAVPLSDVLVSLANTDTIDVKIEGTIVSVCQAKGCWMNVVGDNADVAAFVKFKDYAFFVPKDASGKKSIIEGRLYNAITSVEELRHYASDEGASDEDIAAITEPEEELRIMASGVIIYDKDSN